MPDSRSHRGAHPEDVGDFSVDSSAALRRAARELSFLLGHDYAPDASLKLVGDHHQLTARQRKAVARAACSEAARTLRAARRVTVAALRGRVLSVDGFNCLITVEAMLSRAPLFRGRDGALRDLASVHGTYRTVQETERAARSLVCLLAESGVREVRVLLDRPVGNSGRARALLAEAFVRAALPAEVVLSDSVDRELVRTGDVVASSDSWILDRAQAWVDLPAALLTQQTEPPWLIEFDSPGDEDGARSSHPDEP
jgi:hypothetical protein